MAAIEVGEVWGVEHRVRTHLQAAAIQAAKDLRDTPPGLAAFKIRGRDGAYRKQIARISCLALEEVAPPKKQIVSSRSFGQPVHALSDLSEAVASHASHAAQKLRAQDGVCHTIHPINGS